MRVRLERDELTLSEPLIVRGVVRLRVGGAVYVRRLAVEAIVHTRLDEPDAEGDHFEELAAEVGVFEGVLEPGRDEHPFELRVPAAPCTLDALGARVQYEIRATAVFDHEDRPCVASAPLRVDPAARLGDIQVSKHHVATRGLAGVVLGAGAILLGVLGARPFPVRPLEHWGEREFLDVTVMPALIVIGAVVAAHQLRRFLRERRAGPDRLRVGLVARAPDGYRDSEARQFVRVETQTPSGREPVPFVLLVTARRTRLRAVGSGSDRTYVEHVSTAVLHAVSGQAEPALDGRSVVELPLPLPAPPPSFDGPRLSVEWRLRMGHLPDSHRAEVPLVAHPPRAE